MFASFNMRWWTIQLLMDKFNSKCRQLQAADSSCIDKAESGDTVFEAFMTVCVYYAVDKKLMWRRQPPQQPHPQIFDRRKHKFTQQQDFWQIKTQKAQRNSAAPFLFSPAVIQNNELLLKAFSIVPGEIVRGGWKLKGVRRYVSWDGWWEGLVKRRWHNEWMREEMHPPLNNFLFIHSYIAHPWRQREIVKGSWKTTSTDQKYVPPLILLLRSI